MLENVRGVCFVLDLSALSIKSSLLLILEGIFEYKFEYTRTCTPLGFQPLGTLKTPNLPWLGIL